MSVLPAAIQPIFEEAERQFILTSEQLEGFSDREVALYHITEIASELCQISALTATILLFEYSDWMEKTPREVNAIIVAHQGGHAPLTIMEVVRFLMRDAIENHLEIKYGYSTPLSIAQEEEKTCTS